MSSTQSKTSRHAKKQKNVTHNQKKNQATETDPEIIEMMELAEKDIKNHCYKYVPLAQRCKGKYERNRKCFLKK